MNIKDLVGRIKELDEKLPGNKVIDGKYFHHPLMRESLNLLPLCGKIIEKMRWALEEESLRIKILGSPNNKAKQTLEEIQTMLEGE